MFLKTAKLGESLCSILSFDQWSKISSILSFDQWSKMSYRMFVIACSVKKCVQNHCSETDVWVQFFTDKEIGNGNRCEALLDLINKNRNILLTSVLLRRQIGAS